MDCDDYLQGRVLSTEEKERWITIRIAFTKHTNKFTLRKEECNIEKLARLAPGMEVLCIFKANKLIKISPEPGYFEGEAIF